MTQSSQYKPIKIISGGQTGVDRGALDAAMALGIETGGWCPKDRRSEDGSIPSRYAVTELDSPGYETRTEKNVIESDATLILSRGSVSGGTALTLKLANRLDRPVLVINPDDPEALKSARVWLERVLPRVLNVAGPRESGDHGIQHCAYSWLVSLLKE